MSNIEIKITKNKGKGIYANVDFIAGETILIFKGNIINQRNIYSVQISSFEHIDVEEPERYVNHSCDSNCGIKNKLELVAIKDIKKGEEITFDYAMTEYEISEQIKCYCGSDNCRKIITGYKDLPEDIKYKYREYTSEHLLIKCNA